MKLAYINLVLLTSAVFAQTPASQTLSISCEEVKPVATAYFASRSLPLSSKGTCHSCLSGQTNTLHDADGEVVSIGHAMQLYMVPNRFRRSNPVIWYSHSRHLDTEADLTLTQTNAGCNASLLFHYAWYGAQFILFVPVDGDRESLPSNLRLEREYLDVVAKLVSLRGGVHTPPPHL